MRKEKTLKNSRIIPTIEQILGDKNVSIEVYMKFQIESYRNPMVEENHRYIYCDNIILSEWEKELKINRKTISKNIKYLLLIGILKKKNVNGKDVYIIFNRYKNYLLFESKFIEGLLDINMKNLIKTYLVYYKYSRYYDSCRIEKARILKEIGMSNKAKGNMDMITKINTKLEELGLINIIRTTKRQNGHNKTMLQITAPIYYETDFYKKYVE